MYLCESSMPIISSKCKYWLEERTFKKLMFVQRRYVISKMTHNKSHKQAIDSSLWYYIIHQLFLTVQAVALHPSPGELISSTITYDTSKYRWRKEEILSFYIPKQSCCFTHITLLTWITRSHTWSNVDLNRVSSMLPSRKSDNASVNIGSFRTAARRSAAVSTSPNKLSLFISFMTDRKAFSSLFSHSMSVEEEAVRVLPPNGSILVARVLSVVATTFNWWSMIYGDEKRNSEQLNSRIVVLSMQKYMTHIYSPWKGSHPLLRIQ